MTDAEDLEFIRRRLAVFAAEDRWADETVTKLVIACLKDQQAGVTKRETKCRIEGRDG